MSTIDQKLLAVTATAVVDMEQVVTEAKKLWFEVTTIFIVIIYFVVGVAFYHNQEGWDHTTCVYFIINSICTVGYGQLHPTTDPTRVFTVFYVFFGILLILAVAYSFIERWLLEYHDAFIQRYFMAGYSGEMKLVCFSISLLLTLLFIGTLTFSVMENWTVAKGFYWTSITMMTVGYVHLSY